MSIYGKDIEERKSRIREYFDSYPSEEDIRKRFGEHSFNDTPYGFIYLVRNNKSGRTYIGQTVMGFSTTSGTMRRYPTGWIQDHWSNVDVKNDLHDYGWGSFDDMKVLRLAYSAEELNVLEGYYIGLYDSILNGYNTSLPNPEKYIYGKNKSRSRIYADDKILTKIS